MRIAAALHVGVGELFLQSEVFSGHLDRSTTVRDEE